MKENNSFFEIKDINELVHKSALALAIVSDQIGAPIMIGMQGEPENPEFFVLAIQTKRMDQSLEALTRAIFEIRRMNPEHQQPIQARNIEHFARAQQDKPHDKS